MKKKRGRPPAITTEMKAVILAKKAAGLSQVQIGKDLKIGRQTVAKYVNQPDIREKIEQVGEALLQDTLDDTVTLIKDTIDTSIEMGLTVTDGDVEKVDKDLLALRNTALKTGDRIQQAAGIMPSQTTNYIQNILVKGDMNVLTPNVEKVLAEQMKDIEIIDVEEGD